MGKIDPPQVSERRPRADVLPVALPPRGVNREQAAAYVGVSPTLFDQMVDDGRMPKPKRASAGRLVWSVPRLAVAFDALPDENGQNETKNEWDDLCASSSKTDQGQRT